MSRRESIKIERHWPKRSGKCWPMIDHNTALRQMLSLFENESFASSFNELREMQKQVKNNNQINTLVGEHGFGNYHLFSGFYSERYYEKVRH